MIGRYRALSIATPYLEQVARASSQCLALCQRPRGLAAVVFLPSRSHLIVPRFPSCRARQISLLEQEHLQRTHGRSPQNFSTPNVFAVQHATLAADDRVVVEPRMFADSDLPADQALSADCATAGDAGLRCDHGVFAYLDVVRDLNQVVEF